MRIKGAAYAILLVLKFKKLKHILDIRKHLFAVFAHNVFNQVPDAEFGSLLEPIGEANRRLRDWRLRIRYTPLPQLTLSPPQQPSHQ